MRQRAGGRPEHDDTGVAQVEGGLVTRAEQVVGLLLVQAHRTAHVGADLRVGHDPRDGSRAAGLVEVPGVEPEQQVDFAARRAADLDRLADAVEAALDWEKLAPWLPA